MAEELLSFSAPPTCSTISGNSRRNHEANTSPDARARPYLSIWGDRVYESSSVPGISAMITAPAPLRRGCSTSAPTSITWLVSVTLHRHRELWRSASVPLPRLRSADVPKKWRPPFQVARRVPTQLGVGMCRRGILVDVIEPRRRIQPAINPRRHGGALRQVGGFRKELFGQYPRERLATAGTHPIAARHVAVRRHELLGHFRDEDEACEVERDGTTAGAIRIDQHDARLGAARLDASGVVGTPRCRQVRDWNPERAGAGQRHGLIPERFDETRWHGVYQARPRGGGCGHDR
jgi:hypothetical protein